MQFIDFKTALKDFTVFSLADIAKVNPTFHRQRLNEWQKKGYLRKVIKGYYCFADAPLNEKALFVIANKIYAPSYISLETALSLYGLIPEGVYTLTSVSARPTHTFSSDIGTFSYRHIKPALMFGYRLSGQDGQTYAIAEPEKALLDYLYLHPELRTSEALVELRINADTFVRDIDRQKLDRYLEQIGNAALKHRMHQLVSLLTTQP